MGDSRHIRTSTLFIPVALAAASSLACAKGTEISLAEVVILQALPPEALDAGADAAAPSEPPADQSAPVSTDAEL